MTRNSRRQTRVSTNQQETIVQFIEQNSSFVTKKFDSGPEFTNQDLDQMWNILTELLNSDRTGPAKSKDKWKKVLSDWKCNTKAKAAQLKRETSESGEGVNSSEHLSSLEERLLDAFGDELLGGAKSEKPSVEFIIPSSDFPVMSETTASQKKLVKNPLVITQTMGNSKTVPKSMAASKTEVNSQPNLQRPNVRSDKRTGPIMITLNTWREPTVSKQTHSTPSPGPSDEQDIKFGVEDNIQLNEKLQSPVKDNEKEKKNRKRIYDCTTTAKSSSGSEPINAKKGHLCDASETSMNSQNCQNLLLKDISQALVRQAEATEALVQVKKEKNEIAREMVQVLRNVVDVLAGKT